jgi:hypothetical protein
MTSINHKTVARTHGAGTGGRPSRRTLGRVRWLLGGSALVAVAACQDQNIPFYTAPTSVAATPGGIQNAVSGLFAASRQDISAIILDVAAGYGRDGGVWTNTEVRTVQYPMGATSTPTTSGTIWAQEYQNILQAQQLEAVIPSVGPPYSAANQSALLGLAKTLRAIAYMNIAEAHDTAGFAIRPAGNLSAPPAAICVKDAWIYIVALLDTANAELNSAGAIPLPVILPTGFAALQMAGPSTAPGTFASLNRALAAKAMLERAYADNRIAPADTTKLVDDPTLVPAPNMTMVD